MRDLKEIAEALGGASRCGEGWKCKCPAHEDNTPSFSIWEKGGVLGFKCFAGCSYDDCRAALEERGLIEPDKEIVYTYVDETGHPLVSKNKD